MSDLTTKRERSDAEINRCKIRRHQLCKQLMTQALDVKKKRVFGITQQNFLYSPCRLSLEGLQLGSSSNMITNEAAQQSE